jgi:aminocarboxymuconate-semialdehyde decarboxylase
MAGTSPAMTIDRSEHKRKQFYREDTMLNRRGFLRHAAAATAGVVCVGCGLRHATAQTATRREVIVGGRRVRTVDVHAHCAVPAVLDLVRGTPFERPARQQLEGNLGFPVEAKRVADMDKDGIDVQALSINAFWYGADRDLARRLYDLQSVKVAEMCKAIPGRFVGYAPVSLQFPEFAAEQLEHGMKNLGLIGAAIGGSVEGEEIGSAQFDPFWKKAEELQALVFIHPQVSAQATGIVKRVQGSGALANVIGNPLETSLALVHLIFQGTLDKFPNLKICSAHGGGYLPSYAARMDHGCSVFPEQCKGPTLKKKPSDYLKQLYFDTLVFTGEALRHLVAEHGASQLMIGTDYAVPWVKGPVDHVLNTPGLTDDERIAILGGNAAKLIKLPA